MSQKRYKIQELAAMLKPGQLGLSEQYEAFLFKPENQYDPRLAYLLEQGWTDVRKIDNVVQAYPTSEHYTVLEESGIEFKETSKARAWRFAETNQPTSFEPAFEYDIGEWDAQENHVLFDYQREAAKFLFEHQRAMLSLSPGLGKTLTSAYAAGLKGFQNVLAVVPASLLYYWKSELAKWEDKLPMKPHVAIWHREVVLDTWDGVKDDEQLWIITNPETVARHLDRFFEHYFDCLIADESIMYKHRDSQRSKAMKSLAKSIPTVWLLTGAPATKDLGDMWHQFHILKPKGYRSYWRFARRYCIVDDNDWGSKVVANKPDGEKQIKKNFQDIYFARSQDEVANIPDWVFEDLDIPMTVQQEKIYHKLREELVIELEGVDDNQVLTVTNHLALMIRSIQVASNPVLVGAADTSGKWDALPELMSIYPGPYIVWVNFIETGERIRDMLSVERTLSSRKFNSTRSLRVALANGSTRMEDRNKMVESIQKGETDVIILNNQVGKFGFNLTKARTAFFLERMYDDSYFQCLHRNRRIGTEQSPIIVKMKSVYQNGHHTIDHVIDGVLDYRVGMIQRVTAGMLRKAFENDKE